MVQAVRDSFGGNSRLCEVPMYSTVIQSARDACTPPHPTITSLIMQKSNASRTAEEDIDLFQG